MPGCRKQSVFVYLVDGVARTDRRQLYAGYIATRMRVDTKGTHGQPRALRRGNRNKRVTQRLRVFDHAPRLHGVFNGCV